MRITHESATREKGKNRMDQTGNVLRRSVRRYLVSAAAVALVGLLLGAAPVLAACIDDLQGPDDEAGQKDLNRLCEGGSQTCQRMYSCDIR